MTVSEAISTRQSIRSYMTRKVEDEKLTKVLEAGRLAPSAANEQPLKFILVRDKKVLEAMFDAVSRQPFMENVPAIIAVVATGSRTMHCGVETGAVNASIAMSFMILQAHELGLGTCWLGHFDQEKVKSVLCIPDHMKVIAVTPIGYVREVPEKKTRRKFDEIISFDGF